MQKEKPSRSECPVISPLSASIALLAQYEKPQRFSLLLTLAALVMLLFSSTLSFYALLSVCVVVIAGMLQIVLAVRIGFDHALLKQLVAVINAEKEPVDLDSTLADMDNSLSALGLLADIKAGRTLNSRLKGCVRLFKMQFRLLVLQLAMLLVAVLIQHINIG